MSGWEALVILLLLVAIVIGGYVWALNKLEREMKKKGNPWDEGGGPR